MKNLLFLVGMLSVLIMPLSLAQAQTSNLYFPLITGTTWATTPPA
jgi:hypothetical protein